MIVNPVKPLKFPSTNTKLHTPNCSVIPIERDHEVPPFAIKKSKHIKEKKIKKQRAQKALKSEGVGGVIKFPVYIYIYNKVEALCVRASTFRDKLL
jgi:hypothetical protein